MRQHSNLAKDTAEKVVKDIRRATRKHYSAEEKIRIVLEGLRGEDSIAELCRREGIAQNLYYRWSKDFLEAGLEHCATAFCRRGPYRFTPKSANLLGFSAGRCRSPPRPIVIRRNPPRRQFGASFGSSDHEFMTAFTVMQLNCHRARARRTGRRCSVRRKRIGVNDGHG